MSPIAFFRAVTARLRRAFCARFAPEKWVVVELLVASPINWLDQPADLIRHFESERQDAGGRIHAIRALTAAGFTMDPPAIVLSDPGLLIETLAGQQARRRRGEHRITQPVRCDGDVDFTLRFRRRFRDPHVATATVARLAIDSRSMWNLGWDEQPDGDVQWWCPLEDCAP